MYQTAFAYSIVILIVLDALFTFKPVGIPNITTVRHAEETEIADSFATDVEILESLIDAGICDTLTKCPNTEELITVRQMCFAPPPRGYIYHCGFDPNEKIYVDFYYRPYKCGKGTYGAPKVDGPFVKIECLQCPADTFNPQDRYSPASMDECHIHYHIPVSLETHVILFQHGNSTHPAVYYCDHENGWVSEDKSLFCRHSYQPCRCVNKGDSCEGGDLLPDDRCVPTCAKKRLPQNNFDCVILTKPKRPASEDFDAPSTLLEEDTAVSHETTLSQTSVVSKIDGKGGDKLQEPADVSLGVIITVCVCFIVGIIIAIVICWRIRNGGSRCININRNTINIEGDLIKAKGKHNIIKLTPSDDNQSDATNYSDQLENENANDAGQSTTLLIKTKEDDESRNLTLLKEVVHSSDLKPDIETSESTSMILTV